MQDHDEVKSSVYQDLEREGEQVHPYEYTRPGHAIKAHKNNPGRKGQKNQYFV